MPGGKEIENMRRLSKSIGRIALVMVLLGLVSVPVLAADGITIVDDIVYIQRGYERFEEKLRSLGAVIERVSTEREIRRFTLKVS